MLEWKKIGEVCNVLNGFSFKSHEYTPTGIRIIRISDVQSGYISDKDKVYYPVDKLDEFKRFILNDGDIVMSLTGNPGRVAFIKKDSLPCALNQRVACLRPKKVNGSYLYYLFNCSEFESIAYANSTGGAQKNLSTTWLNNFQIPIPSIAEQQRIVGILDTFTAAIDNLKQQIEQRRKQYEHYRDQLLDLEGKEGVEMKKLGDVLVSLKTGLNPRKNFVLNSPGSKNFYITVRELGHYNITPTDKTDMVTDEALKLINNRSNLEKGDVLFSGTGTIGRTALVKEKPINWNIKEGVYTLKPVQSVISSKFLIELLHINPIMDKIDSFIVGDPIRSVPMKSLVLVSIPVPSLEEQSRIVGILDTFEASITNLEQQLEMRQKQYEYYREKLLSF